MTRVVIDTNGPTITIEADGAAADLAEIAWNLFLKAAALYPIRPPKPAEVTHSMGFANVERSAGPAYVSGYDVDLRGGP